MSLFFLQLNSNWKSNAAPFLTRQSSSWQQCVELLSCSSRELCEVSRWKYSSIFRTHPELSELRMRNRHKSWYLSSLMLRFKRFSHVKRTQLALWPVRKKAELEVAYNFPEIEIAFTLQLHNLNTRWASPDGWKLKNIDQHKYWMDSGIFFSQRKSWNFIGTSFCWCRESNSAYFWLADELNSSIFA